MADSASICVFAGSSPGARPEYMAAARDLGAELARRGHDLVYGGSATGLMGAVADAVLEGFFITVVGTAGTTVIFAGDRWSDFAGNGLGYNQWCPLTFSGTMPSMASLTSWALDAAAGTWRTGPDNNYALNPSFEADRVTMTEPAGWLTSTTSSGGLTPYTNVSGGHTGNWAWQLSATSDYQATLSQMVTGLPAGTYTLSAWVKSTGGQTIANLYATASGGAEKDASLTKAMSGWTQVTLAGVAVSNGQCQIGVTTTATGSQSVTVDDFTFVRTGS